MNKRALLCVASSALLALAGCASMSGPKTIAQTAAATPSLSTLNKLIADAGLTDTLNGTGPYTVFAPTDEAFKAVPAKTLADLAKDKEQLKAVLTYHVLPGKVTAGDVKTGAVKSIQGANLNVAKAGGFVTVEDALVTQADVTASNGVVHVIDKVLIPPKR
ncbi:MAG TPA: fasciclin domain-containing protein [Methylibium sp.]|uniref:fasciclin domain-containing protein n=1 Tax=Methylibium sp. TaxID=2067992 RepID=UPI002DB631B3|nr:fasciclin domain-containing protein [Methylibium sp.]HEU4459049.1 fasciclin domain-containing protein [Methylibium sp.]